MLVWQIESSSVKKISIRSWTKYEWMYWGLLSWRGCFWLKWKGDLANQQFWMWALIVLFPTWIICLFIQLRKLMFKSSHHIWVKNIQIRSTSLLSRQVLFRQRWTLFGTCGWSLLKPMWGTVSGRSAKTQIHSVMQSTLSNILYTNEK